MHGTLFVCATPIGNMEDITLRVLRILREVDFIAAEDTRHTLKLLNYFEIKNSLVSHHEHNRFESAERICARIEQGESCALVTDAGMPCVSDPGFELIKRVREIGAPVTVCPGASAMTAAMALCGFDSSRFIFEGFPPRNGLSRRQLFDSFRFETRSLMLFESPHRLKKTLEELQLSLGDRFAAVLRELTKVHETVCSGTLAELIEEFSENEPKGEIVIVISGAAEDAERLSWSDMTIEEHVELYQNSGMAKSEALKRVARDRGVSKGEIYKAMLGEHRDD